MKEYHRTIPSLQTFHYAAYNLNVHDTTALHSLQTFMILRYITNKPPNWKCKKLNYTINALFLHPLWTYDLAFALNYIVLTAPSPLSLNALQATIVTTRECAETLAWQGCPSAQSKT